MKLTSREAKMKDFGFAIMPPAGTNVGDEAPDALNNPSARTNYETKFVYEVPLFTGFKLTKAHKMATLQVKANKAKYNYDKKELALEVLKAYNGAVAAKYFISATKKAKEATASFVNFAQEMFKEGYVAEIDVKQARVIDLKTNGMLLEAKSKYNLALAYLRFLTNTDDITDTKDFKMLNFNKVDLITLQEKALSIRDDLEWMKLNTATMKEKIDFEKSAKYPMIGAHLEYGFNDNKFSIDDTQDYYVIATGLEYKIFDANIINNEIEKAKVEYKKTKNYLDYMIEGIKLQVEKTYLTLQTKQAVLKEKLKARDLAEDVLIQAEEMYKNHLITMNELLMQQANAQKARAEAIMAKYEVTIASAKLQLAIGKEIKQGE
jgi:outer membrane protein TolC